LNFVISKNIKRRHLTASQKAILALEIKPLLAEEAKKRQLSGLKQFQESAVTLKKEEREEKGEANEQAGKISGTTVFFKHVPLYIRPCKRLFFLSRVFIFKRFYRSTWLEIQANLSK